MSSGGKSKSMPSASRSAHTATNGERARKREEAPTSTIASAIVKTMASSTVVSSKGADKVTAATTFAKAADGSSKPSKMDPTLLIVTVPGTEAATLSPTSVFVCLSVFIVFSLAVDYKTA